MAYTATPAPRMRVPRDQTQPESLSQERKEPGIEVETQSCFKKVDTYQAEYLARKELWEALFYCVPPIDRTWSR